MNLTVKEVESFYSRIKKTLPTEDHARNLHLEVVGNHARLFSTLEGDPTHGTIDLESGILTTSSGYQDEGEGPNLLLEQLFLPDGMILNIDGNITFASYDPVHLGRITAISAHLNSHRTVPHARPSRLPFIPPRKDDRQLFVLDGLCGGYESIYQIAVSEKAYHDYRQFISPFQEVIRERQPYFLDLSIYFHYRDSCLLENPLRPDGIRVMVKLRNTHTKLRYELDITND